MAHPSGYASEERIFCYHGPLTYEAKILKIEPRPNGEEGYQFFVHYKGWKSKWDEWVPESRIMKYNQGSIEKQRELQEVSQSLSNKKSASRQSIGPTRSEATPPAVPTSGASGVAAKIESEKPTAGSKRSSSGNVTAPAKKRQKTDKGSPKAKVGDDGQPSKRKNELHLNFPENLKMQLMEDWENVTRKHMCVALPRSPTAFQIIEAFRQHKLATVDADAEEVEMVNEMLHGVRLYFDRALGNMLLYRAERPQYSHAKERYMHDGETAAQVYGAEHLLRLFVKLPLLVSEANLDEEAISVLNTHLQEFLQYISERFDDLFMAEYDNVPLEFLNQGKYLG